MIRKTNLANKSNYGGVRSVSNIKYIVVHYTGNDGDTDECVPSCFTMNPITFVSVDDKVCV